MENCSGCGSWVRIRAVLAALSLELFGVVLRLDDFPVMKSIRGLGLSDCEIYARILADRFEYRNTYFDRPPRLDISEPDPAGAGTLDFLLSTEVFEHVRPPVEQTFRNVRDLLREDGVLVMTVPYEVEGAGQEHYPELRDYGIATLRNGPVLVNRTGSGQLQVFEGLVFHGGEGSTLEMRCFSEGGLRQALAAAGFEYVRIHGENYPEFGIVYDSEKSLPVTARRRPSSDKPERFNELVQRYGESCEKRRQWVARLEKELASEREATRIEHEAKDRLHEDLKERTRWARSLEQQLAEKTAWALSLDADAKARIEWARDLEQQLKERTAWALELERHANAVEAELARTRSGMWHRLGRRLGLGK